MQTYVINLKSQTQRRAFQVQQLTRLGLDFEILEAVTAADIDDATYQSHYHDWLRPLKKVEVACYYSHQRCWQAVIDSNQAALILEDDVLLSQQLPQLLAELETQSDKHCFDFIDLEVTPRKKYMGKKSQPLSCGLNLLKLYINSYGAAGYVLFPSGAKKLLEQQAQRGIALADAHIAQCYALNAYQAEPAQVIQFDVCEQFALNTPATVDAAFSATSIGQKHKKTLAFQLRRGISELQLGLRKLAASFVSQRRLVTINAQAFALPMDEANDKPSNKSSNNA